jgi:DNA-binding NarL/FixJ family response regulator
MRSAQKKSRRATKAAQYGERTKPGVARPSRSNSRFGLVRGSGAADTLDSLSDVPEKISVLLVDDHELVRSAFRRLLADDPAIEVIGEAGDGDAAVDLARSLKPGVIVMDHAMPSLNGLAATRKILRESPDVAILIVSMHTEELLVLQALEAGARGYVMKDAVAVDLAATVRRVAAGETVVEPNVVRAAPAKRVGAHGLSARQLEVLELICHGLSNRAIAARLGVSIHTVHVHRGNIMKTLGIGRVTLLVSYAIRHRLVKSP